MTITVLHQSATLPGLVDQGVPARPGEGPSCHFSGIDVALRGAGNNACGLWECTPGRFHRQLPQAEVMHILTGKGTFFPAKGESVRFVAGDTLFFPANTEGEWLVEETIRKVFVVLSPS